MLDSQAEVDGARLAEQIARLTCNIELPLTWTDFFQESGLVRAELPEKRRHLRWKNRTTAGLFYQQTYAALPRPEQWHPIYLKDLSRSGVAFIHYEQLFPLERLRICFLDDMSVRLLPKDKEMIRDVEVAHCRFVQPNCFEVGVRFIDT